jgi:tetratricopeptide (TPR) repeat protein
MKCPKCQTENPEGATFCINCGARVAEDVSPSCPACGTELPAGARFCFRCGQRLVEPASQPTAPPSPEPTSFAEGRYQVKRFLGEGGRKKVYLAHDALLDRDVAFALLKTETLDDVDRSRITREAQAMGRLGSHPHIVTVFDLGEHEGQPYIVAELMAGGDVEGLMEKAPQHRLPLEQALDIAKSVCLGLEFAHAKGIVHRDLKPGNVWLTADGTAKIGDFGLALAVDLSRLTQSGMMVGTVSYMPPEQAMGGQVTPQADLYSLGAMLYEMVTGRPPFLGDDPVAIIGQHINTPPVSPTWHRPDLPPALEALILQLLEKDPQRRPASAADVRQALESIEARKVAEAPPAEAPTLAESPLYRRVFVGREAELKRLQSAFNGAVSGNGSLVMVVGEPGIGKTALCEQLATYVALRGGRTLVGHCYEEGSLSLPYLAFVEALRSYVLAREVDDLREELDTGAADVARIVSEVRERLRVEVRPPGDPEEERYRLLQAVSGFLSNAATVQPLLVVLEDLHDADQGTLEMLTHVARSLAGMRVLLVGTYRDVEVDRAHPLSAALAELRRAATYGRVLLRGLNADEVRRMLEGITGQEIPWGLAEAVHRQTEGNPLFVQEVVRYMAEEGLIAREEGRWRPTGPTPLEMSIPEGLRHVIGKRLSLLSAECNRLLSIAAVIGREFRLQVLQRVAGTSEGALFAALEEAKGAAVVEERALVGAAVSYRFAHAFFRQALYEEMIAPRRIRLHQQVARALEEVYAARLEEHAAELAEHFSYSSDPADLAKAVAYGELAAGRATSVYAYGEAVRLLEQALQVQEVLDPEDMAKRCDLLLALAAALARGGYPRRALDVELPEALSLAEAIGDSTRASEVCYLASWTLFYYGAHSVFTTSEAVQWAERADRCAQPDTVWRVWADILVGVVKCLSGNRGEGLPLLSRALELARRLGDSQALSWAACDWMEQAQAPQYAEERLHLAEELAAGSRAGLDLKDLFGRLRLIGDTFLASGQRRRAEEVWSEARGLAERSGQVNLVLMSLQMDAIRATVDGRLQEAVEITQRILARGQELGLSEHSAYLAEHAGVRPRLYLGKADEALQLTRDDPSRLCVRVPCLAHLGQDAEVVDMLEQLVLRRPGMGSAEDETPAWEDTLLLEAAVLVGHRQAAELLLRRLADSSAPTSGRHHITCTARHLGAAAALLGRPDEARAHYQTALEVATEMRFRPEVALTRLQLAELFLEHYPEERAEALEHLDFAIAEFRDMKMQPSLERALRHKDILKA